MAQVRGSRMSTHSDVPSRFGQVDGPRPEMYGRVQSAIDDAIDDTGAGTVRTRARVVTAVIVIAAMTAIVAWASSELVHGRPAAGLELAVTSTARLLAVLSALVALTVVATTVALRRGNGGFGTRAIWLALVAVSTAPLYAVVTAMLPVHERTSGDVGVAGVAISPWGARCILVATIVSAFALIAFASALRRAVVTASAANGAAVGAAAGSWAGLGVFLFCPSGNLQHLLVGHALIILVVTIVGALFVSRSLRPCGFTLWSSGGLRCPLPLQR
jgi:hypothetical protein